MTTTDRTGDSWQEAGYGDVVSASRVGDQIEVQFANGDAIQVSPSQFGVRGEFRVSLEREDDELSVRLDGEENSRILSWSQLRAATDPDFAQEMRRQDAEESRRLGLRLRALREDRGLTQKDLANLVGMSSPQLSKIENGTSDLRFSTIQSLLRAMGATLTDISGPDALEISQRAIRKRAADLGVGRDLMDRVLGLAPREAVPRLLKRSFGWDIADLAPGASPPEPQAVGFAFKTAGPQDASASPLVTLARVTSKLVREHVPATPFDGVSPDAAEVRAEVCDPDGPVRLKRLVDWTWDRGVSVIPLHGRGGFCAAAWMVGDSPAVILKESRDLAVFWLFDLAHELGHIAHGHLNGGGVVDVDDITPGERTDDRGDEQEHEANVFALQVLLGDYVSLLESVRTETRGNYLRFKSAVTTVARQAQVDAGLLGMVAAFELDDIGEPKDRWGSATNLAKAEGEGRPIALESFHRRVDHRQLAPDDAAIIDAAVGAG